MNYILIDTSYMIFYRYHALIRWWKHSHETELPTNLLDCEEFVTKFIKLFSESILKIKKQLKLHFGVSFPMVLALDKTPGGSGHAGSIPHTPAGPRSQKNVPFRGLSAPTKNLIIRGSSDPGRKM